MDSSAPASAPQGTPLSSLLTSALEVGALTGGGGLLLGGAQGILFSGSPKLFAAFAGVQWFTAGTVYWATRSAILNNRIQAWHNARQAAQPGVSETDAFLRNERVKASTVAGGVSGGVVAAVTRSRSHIVPGAVMFAIFGFAGQHLYNFMDTKHAEREQAAAEDKSAQKENWLQRLANSRFSPVKVLSDDEYEHMLKEKMLKVDVEIALVDEAMDKLRQERNQNRDVADK